MISNRLSDGKRSPLSIEYIVQSGKAVVLTTVLCILIL